MILRCYCSGRCCCCNFSGNIHNGKRPSRHVTRPFFLELLTVAFLHITASLRNNSLVSKHTSPLQHNKTPTSHRIASHSVNLSYLHKGSQITRVYVSSDRKSQGSRCVISDPAPLPANTRKTLNIPQPSLMPIATCTSVTHHCEKHKLTCHLHRPLRGGRRRSR